MFSAFTKQRFLSGLWRSSLRLNVLVALNEKEHVRQLSRARSIPPRQTSDQMSKEEYKNSILERARLRRELLEQEQAGIKADGHAQEVTQVEETEDTSPSDSQDEYLSDVSSASDSEFEENEEEALTEKELFSGLLAYQEMKSEAKPRLYVPFVQSEDDDEYKPEPEEDYVAEIFEKMERDVEISHRKAHALYPEEEVVVQLVDFEDDEEESGPVRLDVSAPVAIKPESILYLRRMSSVYSTKTKMFNRSSTININVLKQHEFDSSVRPELIRSLQQILDWYVEADKEDFARALFDEIATDTENSVQYLQSLLDMCPSLIRLIDIAKLAPEILLLKSQEALNLGIECAGALYPCLYNFRTSFHLGLCHIELMEDVFRLGSKFKLIQWHLSASEEMPPSLLRDKIEDANSIVPNFAKILESSSAYVSSQTIVRVVQNPQLTKERISICKKKVYNWPDFNLYAYANFTLSDDDVKFNRFCEMYNMTRKLQMDLAEDPADREEGDIPDMLYFWKESWMHNEQYSNHKLPNGILPQQFTAMYEAFEDLELEGLTWNAFLRGLSILSEQREVTAYDEIHFYERLAQSRVRTSPSRVLKDGLANVIRNMCTREQLRMENEPQTSESPLFELEPIHKEDEIFA